MSKVGVLRAKFPMFISLLAFVGWIAPNYAESTSDSISAKIDGVKWIHGSKDCSQTQDPSIQVFQLSVDTFILRESKCVHFEAPFMYLLMGDTKAFLYDTGATADEKLFPLAATVRSILDERQKQTGKILGLVVAHSHAHSDHVAGDVQFGGMPKTTVVGKKVTDVISYFQFSDWPNRSSTFDLGSRMLDLLPIPGHEDSHIAVYDRETGVLLTGDSFYPGHLFEFNWNQYKQSMDRLVKFTEGKPVNAILGGHVEMTNKPYASYEYPTIFQPHEHSLTLTIDQFRSYNQALQKKKQPDSQLFKDYILSDQEMTEEAGH